MDPLLDGTLHRGGADALRIFREAFLTEIGPSEFENNNGRLISLRELLDVIICSGKDIQIEDKESIEMPNPQKPLKCQIREMAIREKVLEKTYSTRDILYFHCEFNSF
uniref:Uncharacterized protein n=1 Tax=Meloidogyne incognita TaxID=6306 RepID=A0A914KPF7_MELIC